MDTGNAKTVSMLLYNGDLNGVISVENSSWNSGELYSAPRDAVNDLLSIDACRKFGVYMLISDVMIYIGQSSDLSRRISEHQSGKDWWEKVIVLTTKDDSLNHTDIDFLEYSLIEKALQYNVLKCDNKQKGYVPKVDKFRKVTLEKYLEESFFLLKLIGINVFCDKPPFKMDTVTKLVEGKRAKDEAIKYLNSLGISLDDYISYAVINDSDEYWLNPSVKCLKKSWSIILNNNKERKLVLVSVPADSLEMKHEKKLGLRVRTDNPAKADLAINSTSYIDRKSKTDFSCYVAGTYEY